MILFYDYILIIVTIVIILVYGTLNSFQINNISSIQYLTSISLAYTTQIKLLNIYTHDLLLNYIIIGIIIGLFGYTLILTNVRHFEIMLLILLAFFAFMVLVESTDLLTIFLALELQAFVAYTLIGLHNNLLSIEGALKYFLIGCLASCLFLLGMSYTYSAIAHIDLLIISDLFNNAQQSWELTLGNTLIILALLFKIGSVPYHVWLPDAYQSATYSVLLFLIVFPKIFLYFLLYTLNSIGTIGAIGNIFNQNVILLISIILSAVIGSLQALTQTKIKRFLAYTTIFNTASFLSLLLVSGNFSIYALLYSSFLYAITNVLIILPLVSLRSLHNVEILSLRDLGSLRASHFLLALILIIGFMSTLGMPPLLGFFTKFFIFASLLEKNFITLNLFLIITSILPAFYYLRISTIIFFLPTTKRFFLLSIPFYVRFLLSFIFVFTISFICFPFIF